MKQKKPEVIITQSRKKRIRVRNFQRNQSDTEPQILNILTEEKNTKYLHGDSITSINETNIKPVIHK